MIGDFNKDFSDARAAAAALAAWLEEQLAAGGDPSTLAIACVGLGTDLLAKAQGQRTAAEALMGVARDIQIINEDGSEGKH